MLAVSPVSPQSEAHLGPSRSVMKRVIPYIKNHGGPEGGRLHVGMVYCRLVCFFDCICLLTKLEILGGTPTWDLDVPVHGTVANHAGLVGQVPRALED